MSWQATRRVDGLADALVEGPISKWRLLYVNTAILVLQMVMLSVTVAKYELRAPREPTDDDELLGPLVPSISDEERRGVLMPAPPPLLERRDTHSDDGEERESAELDRMVSEVTAGELVAVRLDVVGSAMRPWQIPGAQPVGTRAEHSEV